MADKIEPVFKAPDSDSDNEMFAYGKTHARGCECPAAKAGLLGDNSDVQGMKPLLIYDNILRKMTGEFSGTVPEYIAQDAWAQTIIEIKDDKQAESRHLSWAQEVATQLDWGMSEYDVPE